MNYTVYFFFNDTATTEIYTLSLHDALPILSLTKTHIGSFTHGQLGFYQLTAGNAGPSPTSGTVRITDTLPARSEEHTSELQSRQYLVCRLLLEKKKKHIKSSRLWTKLF